MYNNTSTMYNINNTHPILPDNQSIIKYNKYVSIHSEDRDMSKYPNSNDFMIELPEDLLKVSEIRLVNWAFPANYSTFSSASNNVNFCFKITSPYNPSEFGVGNDYYFDIFEALFMSKNDPYSFNIEEGFYNPDQMATELTNKLNDAVTQRIYKYLKDNNKQYSLTVFNNSGGYTRFRVVYNTVSLKLWFGNISDKFEIINYIDEVGNSMASFCSTERSHVPDDSYWGLFSYLGLPNTNIHSICGSKLNELTNYQLFNGSVVPRFYYGDVYPGDNGYWLTPNLDFSGSEVNWVEATYKINLMGEAYMYMELDGQNCIDETQPYNISKFTRTTNQTNGIVNSSFAKIAIPSTPLSQWFDRDAAPYKMYNPPAEKIRKLQVKLRYHNGRPVNFGVFNYSFMLQFTLSSNQMLTSTKSIYNNTPY